MGPKVSLADIDVRARVFRDALPHSGFHAACKALARIAQAADAPLSAVPAADALTRYDTLSDVPKSVASDERLSLERALALPALPADVSERIRRGEPTFVDAVVAIETHAIALEQAGKLKEAKTWRGEAGRIKGALDRVADKIGRPKDHIQATAASVDAALAKLTHADFAYDDASGSYVTFCSRVRRAARLVDIRARRRLSASLLSGPWKAIVDAIDRTKKGESCRGHLAKLWPLVAYCECHDLAPAQVDDAVVAALLADLDRHGRADAFDVARNVVYAWERLQVAVPGFPPQTLQRLYRDGPSPHAVPFDELPESFRASWDAYSTAHFRGPGEAPGSLSELVLDEDAEPDGMDPVDSRHHPDAKKDFRTVITYAANIALERGIEIKELRDVLTPAIMHAVLVRVANRQKDRAERQGCAFRSRNYTLKNDATIFIGIARDLGVDEANVAVMEGHRDKVDPTLIKVQKDKKTGKLKRIRAKRLMGPRHADRLRQFTDPVKMLRWFEMPRILEARVRARLKVHRRLRLQDCNDLLVAVVYAISRSTAIRPENYVKLRAYGPQRNVDLPTHHRAEGSIHIDWTEVKNDVDLAIVLPPEAVALIELWLKHARPVVAKAVGAAPDNPFLFPAAGMTHLARGELNKEFVARNRRPGGFVLNLHCQRHMTAKVVLDEDPSKMPLVQILLGHKTIKTTESYYAEINMIFAQRQFHQILAAHEARLRALPPKRRAA